MATISSLGLSGLPLNDLLADLRKVEEAPLALLTQRKASIESRISAYGRIQGALEVFEASAKNLASAKVFEALKTTSSNTAALTATVPDNSAAVAGTYSIHVAHLASTQSLASQGVASRTDALAGAATSLTFTLGDAEGTSHTLDLAADQTSLEGIRTAINEAGLGLSATIVNNGSDTNPYQLVISTTATGQAARVVRIDSANGALDAALFYAETPEIDDPANTITQQVQAKDASITVNGIGITSGTNTLEDAIEGLTLTLTGTTQESAPLTLTVEQNLDTARKAIDTFVNNYNALNTLVRSLTSYNAEQNQASTLTGDTVARSVQNRMSAALNSSVSGGEYGMLWELGISTRVSDGALQIDSAKLTEALKNNTSDVANLFASDNGLIKQVENALQGLLGSRGLLTNATAGAKESISGIQKQFETTQARIDQKMAGYQNQFIQLERYMSEMNGISSYLNSQLGMLESLSKGRNDK